MTNTDQQLLEAFLLDNSELGQLEALLDEFKLFEAIVRCGMSWAWGALECGKRRRRRMRGSCHCFDQGPAMPDNGSH
jgi:hypothetical protein